MIDSGEREFVLRHLRSNRERLLSAVEGLNAEQHVYCPAEERWSVADCVEHIALVENRVKAMIETALAQPPQPEKRAEAVGKEEIILRAVPDRSRRVQGPPPVMPQRKWTSFDEPIGEFLAERERTIEFASSTEADLRNHFFPHFVFKDLDCYQWLLFLGLHCERHVLQIEEVKADSGFPRTQELRQSV